MTGGQTGHGKWQRRWLAAPVGALGALFVLYGDVHSLDRIDDPLEEGTVTYARDVAPIIQENCQLCHQPGSVGPMSLTTYEEVRAWAPIIKEQVSIRNMPPYHYDPNVGIQQLKQDMRLTQEEIETIVAWVESGTPMGDVADLPAPVEWPDASEWRLADVLGGPPDHVVKSDPFTLPAEGPDTWWKPRTPTGLDQDRWVRAIEVKPSVDGRAATHHANSYYVVPTQSGQLRRGQAITEYALGKKGEIIPEGAARRIRADDLIEWDIHYWPAGTRLEDDQVELGFWFYPEDYEPEFEQSLSLYQLVGAQGNGDMVIPPHGTAMTQGFHSWDHPVRIDSFQPHGHIRLRGKSLEIFHPDTGQRELVSMVPNFNAGWHISYLYEDHVAPLVPAGSVMILTAWYDNTADNPLNPDPDQWVAWGNRTTDEMSHAWIAVTHLDQEGYEKLLAEREALADLRADAQDD